MNDQSLKILKLIGLAIAGIGLLLILLSPFIGESLTPGSLWWIEPVAYIGSGVFVLGSVVAFIGF